MTKQRIIIDCDPGIDDSLALLYALQHPKLEVVAITIVAGNCPVNLGVDNTFKILEYLNKTNIPVYVGAEAPLHRDFVSAQDTHGLDGLGETYIKRTTDCQPQTQKAANFLAETFQKVTDISLIAIGPLTNIAQALEINPNLGHNLHRFISMGGSYKSQGNCSPVAEYNYWCDPHAAQLVFQKLQTKIEMVGLDITRKIVLTPNILEYMSKYQPSFAKFISQLTRFYFDFHWQYEHLIGCVINDPLAIAHFLHQDLCQGFDAYTDIVTEGIAMGQSVIDAYNFYNKPANAHILTSVQVDKFFEDFLAILLQLEHKQINNDFQTLKLG